MRHIYHSQSMSSYVLLAFVLLACTSTKSRSLVIQLKVALNKSIVCMIDKEICFIMQRCHHLLLLSTLFIVVVLAKSGRLELEDNILRIL